MIERKCKINPPLADLLRSLVNTLLAEWRPRRYVTCPRRVTPNRRHSMKPPPKVAKPAKAASRPSVRLPAKDLAQVRAIAATANLRKVLRGQSDARPRSGLGRLGDF